MADSFLPSTKTYPEGLSPQGVQPQIDANASPNDPIAEMLDGETTETTEEDATAAEAEAETAPEPTVRRKYRRARRKARRDDWKKNYSIFGGGFGR